MKLDKHGMKMKGLKKAASYTKGVNGLRGDKVQIGYNPESGEIRAHYHVGDSWTVYGDGTVYIGTVLESTMQEIADLIYLVYSVTEV